jgi:hypothetical protein
MAGRFVGPVVIIRRWSLLNSGEERAVVEVDDRSPRAGQMGVTGPNTSSLVLEAWLSAMVERASRKMAPRL